MKATPAAVGARQRPADAGIAHLPQPEPTTWGLIVWSLKRSFFSRGALRPDTIGPIPPGAQAEARHLVMHTDSDTLPATGRRAR